MSSHLLRKMKSKIKFISFKSRIDAISRNTLLFIELNGVDQGKVHGRTTEGYPDGIESATIDDILHTMGCDLFGSTRYNITIQAQEIEDVKSKTKDEEKESPRQEG